MRRRLLLILVALVALAIASAPPGTAGAVRPPAHSKAQAEVNVLRLAARKWKAWRKFGLVDPRTHLLHDNTEAVCNGRGSRSPGNRYPRFVCVVRPHVHRRHQGLLLGYRALTKGRCQIRILAFRRR
jgi:hypothetical protein